MLVCARQLRSTVTRVMPGFCLICTVVLASRPADAYQLRPLPDVDGTGVAIGVFAEAYQYKDFGDALELALKDDLGAMGFRTDADYRRSDWFLSSRDQDPSRSRTFQLAFHRAQGDNFNGKVADLNEGCLDVRLDPSPRRAVDEIGLEAWARCLSRAIILDAMRRPVVTRALSDRGQVQGFLNRSDHAPARPPTRLASAPLAKAIPEGARVAVLQFRTDTQEVSPSGARYLSEKFRQEALRQLPKCEIVTTENLLTLLEASGRKLEDCEGECAVETGRRLGVDLVVTGAIQKVGTSLKLTTSLHETKRGKLLSAAIASAKNLDELDAASLAAAQQLYGPVKQ